MPHHESGLFGVKSTDVKVIDQALAFFLEHEPSHRVELVRVANGKGVILTFGSCLAGDGKHVDVSAFLDVRKLKALAKRLKKAIWVGHAIGGYSNHQRAVHVSSSGKIVWRSEFDFSVPAKLRSQVADPFSKPAEKEALYAKLRAEHGYGRIGAALGFDYWRVLDIELGDALLARSKRVLGTEGARGHAAWLTEPFIPPERVDQEHEGPEGAGKLLIRCLGAGAKTAVVDDVATLLSRMVRERKVQERALRIRTAHKKGETYFVLDGRAMAGLADLICQESFVDALADVCPAGVDVYEVDAQGEFRLRAAAARMANSLAAMFSAQRWSLDLTKLRLTPVALAPGPPQEERLRAPPPRPSDRVGSLNG